MTCPLCTYPLLDEESPDRPIVGITHGLLKISPKSQRLGFYPEDENSTHYFHWDCLQANFELNMMTNKCFPGCAGCHTDLQKEPSCFQFEKGVVEENQFKVVSRTFYCVDCAVDGVGAGDLAKGSDFLS
jgi:hypothetical protein